MICLIKPSVLISLSSALLLLEPSANAQTATFEAFNEGGVGTWFVDPASGITFTNAVNNFGQGSFSVDYGSAVFPPVLPGKVLTGSSYSPGSGVGLTSGFGFTFLPPTPATSVGMDEYYGSQSASGMTITGYSSSGAQVAQANIALPSTFPSKRVVHATLSSATPMTRIVVATPSNMSIGFDNISVTPAPLLSVVSGMGVPGSTVNIAINYVAKTNVSELQFDLLFNTDYLILGSPTLGNALSDHVLLTSVIAPGTLHASARSASHTPITNGVVAYIPFTIPVGTPDHDESLLLTSVLATNAVGNSVSLLSSNGVLAVVFPPQISAIARTDAGKARLTLTGTTGRRYMIQAATNLAAPEWLSFPNVLTGPNPSFEDALAPNFPLRFYRVVVAR